MWVREFMYVYVFFVCGVRICIYVYGVWHVYVVYVYVLVCVPEYTRVCMYTPQHTWEIRGQDVGISSLLTHGSWR